ncbi:NAD(P)-dependent oxidoreductase [Actinokineospora bangkokensis]|uniref:3-hydroxyisobutyrate dehydrogenase n=1 Tax=Actinokineospora bangkokensis TaxID=1193682 RepID=A0A1Q9LJ20_9PSEU|nr:NAD(P)-dependent oxidoreductase [Actinokineospora bangkokensis]OLR92000.1 3-hydroxyisobutyrate dehydrogenase [Actinokineospora bangkokensis]
MTMTVAVLGTGIMGAGMARNLAKAGLDVVVWNRSADKAEALADVARVAGSAQEAVRGARVVVTMLFDLDSTREVMGRVLPHVEGTWVQSATVGLDGAAELGRLAGEHGVAYVDAPVLGTRKPAEDGTLTVLASGTGDDDVAAVFDAIGARTVWVGEEPGAGHRLKLVANAWVLSVVTGTAQSVELARGLGLEPSAFLDAISGGVLDTPYAQLKGKAMISGEYPLQFGLDGARKDSGLIADALVAAGRDDRLMRAIHDLLTTASERGLGGQDMAAVNQAFPRG